MTTIQFCSSPARNAIAVGKKTVRNPAAGRTASTLPPTRRPAPWNPSPPVPHPKARAAPRPAPSLRETLADPTTGAATRPPAPAGPPSAPRPCTNPTKPCAGTGLRCVSWANAPAPSVSRTGSTRASAPRNPGTRREKCASFVANSPEMAPHACPPSSLTTLPTTSQTFMQNQDRPAKITPVTATPTELVARSIPPDRWRRWGIYYSRTKGCRPLRRGSIRIGTPSSVSSPCWSSWW